MNNKLFFITSLLGCAMVVGLFACDDSVRTSALTVDQNQTAELSVFLYAELNKKELGVEYAPDDTRVFVLVDYTELNPASGPGSWVDTLFVKDGMIEAEVPVSSAGSVVTIMPDEFVADQVQPHGASLDVISKIFRAAAQNIADVKPGQNRITEITYNYNAFENLVETVNIRFEGRAVLTDHYQDPDVLTSIPSGTSVTLYTDEWTTNATVGTNGVFTAEVPKNTAVNVEFIARKTITTQDPDGTVKEERLDYKYQTTTPAFSQSLPALQQLNFGTGTLWE